MSDTILGISEPKVMQSAAGFYIGADCLVQYNYGDGTSFTNTEPYDRYSGYFATKDQAQSYLDGLEAAGKV